MEYIKIYNQIIERAKTRQIDGYIEKHHIVPRCMGGSEDKENIIQLTAKEHFLCHLLLVEIYPKNVKLWYSLFLMSINKNKKIKYKVSARTYEQIKLEWNKKAKGNPKPEGFGSNITNNKERGEKISKANKGRPKPKGFGYNHSLKMIGKIQSSQTIKNRVNKLYKPILQYDKQNNFIKEWKSATEAGNELNINRAQINAVARGNTPSKTAGKYKWKYKK